MYTSTSFYIFFIILICIISLSTFIKSDLFSMNTNNHCNSKNQGFSQFFKNMLYLQKFSFKKKIRIAPPFQKSLTLPPCCQSPHLVGSFSLFVISSPVFGSVFTNTKSTNRSRGSTSILKRNQYKNSRSSKRSQFLVEDYCIKRFYISVFLHTIFIY